jgi:hypothetical protein
MSQVRPAALMRMHLEQSPAPLRRPDLATALAALVWQLLEKDPARRPASARETYSRLLPYIGVKHGRSAWLVAALAYFVVPAVGLGLTVASSFNSPQTDIGLALWVLPWPIGFVHAVIVNFSTRLPLLKR